jgi:hypothetical protein
MALPSLKRPRLPKPSHRELPSNCRPAIWKCLMISYGGYILSSYRFACMDESLSDRLLKKALASSGLSRAQVSLSRCAELTSRDVPRRPGTPLRINTVVHDLVVLPSRGRRMKRRPACSSNGVVVVQTFSSDHLHGHGSPHIREYAI